MIVPIRVVVITGGHPGMFLGAHQRCLICRIFLGILLSSGDCLVRGVPNLLSDSLDFCYGFVGDLLTEVSSSGVAVL